MVADPACSGKGGLAVPDERDIGAGAAHVDGQQVVDPGGPPQPGRPERAGSGAGKREMHGAAGGLLGQAGAAVRLHQQQRRLDGAAGEPGGEPADIAPDHRLDRGVQRRRHGALIFPEDGKDIDRQRDFDIRQAGAQNLADPKFVGPVGVGVQQDNRDRIEAGGPNGLHSRLDCSFVERCRFGTVQADPAGHLEDVPRLHRPPGLDP